MRWMLVPFVVVVMLGLAACEPETETTNSIKQCTAGLTGSVAPRNLDQCVETCKICEHGNTMSCTTACRLKGAM